MMMDRQRSQPDLDALRIMREINDEQLHSENLEREDVSPQEEEDIIPQPIPFQMGTTPQDESPPGDDLTDWYDDPPSGARGSTDVGPAPKAKATSRRERSPRNLRNRQVARSIKPEQRVHWNLQAQHREFDKAMTVEEMKWNGSYKKLNISN